MPLYEYTCTECGHDFEVRRKFSDGPVSECPACAGPVEKRVSMSSFSLKGAGWYKDGYSSKSEKPSSCPSASGGESSAGPSGGGCAGCPAAGNSSD